MKMKKEMEKAIMAHIDALGSASEVYSWGGCIYVMFPIENMIYRFRPVGSKYFVSHCGLGRGCFFTEEEEYEI